MEQVINRHLSEVIRRFERAETELVLTAKTEKEKETLLRVSQNLNRLCAIRNRTYFWQY